MISKKSQKDLLKALHYTDEEITSLVDSEEETEVSIKPTTKVYDEAGLNSLKENLKKANLTAGMEIAIKNLKEQTGLDFEGKSPEDFIAHFTEKVQKEANVKPTELTARFEAEKKALQDKVKEEQRKAEALQAQINEVSTERTLLASFPKGERIMSDNDLLLLAKAKIQTRQEGDKTIYSYNGKDMQDDVLNPLDLPTVLNHVFTAEKWIKQSDEQRPSGVGLNDSSTIPTAYKSTADITAALDKKGINPLSKEGREFIEKAVKENPSIVEKK